LGAERIGQRQPVQFYLASIVKEGVE
jgi:hypothetical protein